MTLIERHDLQDSGCGAIDMALLTSALITENTKIWTQDKKLDVLAKKLGVSFKPKLH
jgi:rRNA-processing protein FCF1